MPGSSEHGTPEFLSAASIDVLGFQEQELFCEVWEELVEFLRERGKYPERQEGYQTSSIRPISRRVFQVFEYVWENDGVDFAITHAQADKFLRDLNEDTIRQNCGEPYQDSSKRKFADALETYFRFRSEDWESSIRFTDNEPSLNSDPFTKRESNQLFTAALEYKSPPSYKNLTPDERDRWKARLAQELGKPKRKIGPDDWETLRRCWKIPSLISVSQDGGMRAALVGRLTADLVDLDSGHIVIPSELSVKNEKKWTLELSQRSTSVLERWLDQRALDSKYDESSALWLNRKGNPYRSGTLNKLLGSLIDQAGIDHSGRKLTWHSIRHSTGMYVYNSEKDLELVAEILRQKSLQAAKRYAHPTPETKRDVIESIQRSEY